MYLGVCFEFFFGIIFLAREYYRVSEPGCPPLAERNLIQEIASEPGLVLDGRLVVWKFSKRVAGTDRARTVSHSRMRRARTDQSVHHEQGSSKISTVTVTANRAGEGGDL